jgi:hypothetical protein
MASKPRSVDLGPLYLQVGEDAARAGWTQHGSGADAGDVTRFEALMQKGRKHQERETEAAVDALLEPLREPEAPVLAQPGEIGDEIAHLWVGTGLRSEREVRVGLREALLPDTTVRLSESEGRLRIELACGAARVADWLDRKLPALARELGERLNRPLELVVSMAGGSVVAERRWPGDER